MNDELDVLVVHLIGTGSKADPYRMPKGHSLKAENRADLIIGINPDGFARVIKYRDGGVGQVTIRTRQPSLRRT